jgi:hypothetical protein
MDVKGKTIIVLVNDPPVPDPNDKTALDARTFGGKAMTYYGRWTYKYEKAAEMGAAAVFIVHETAPAGYPWNVVQSFGGERLDLVTPDKNMGRAAIQGWISLDAATKLFKLAGLDYQKLKVEAATRDFKPVPPAERVDVVQADAARPSRRTSSRRSAAAIRPQERIRLLRPLDHFGTCDAVNGDTICNGARSNASGRHAHQLARGSRRCSRRRSDRFSFCA